MTKKLFTHRAKITASAKVVFDWLKKEGAFERLNPPWEHVEVVQSSGGIQDGDSVTLKIPLGPFSQKWFLEHKEYIEGQQFKDVQVKGPFKSYSHTHRVVEDSAHSCFLEDTIEYELPAGKLGELLGSHFIKNKLKRLFEYRQAIISNDLSLHAKLSGSSKTVLVSGASGMIGSALIPLLKMGGHKVLRLVRHDSSNEDEISWNPEQGTINRGSLEGIDAVIHLAGESIAGRWTDEKKKRIKDSRVDGTRNLAQLLASAQNKPEVLICSSGVNYYGSDRGDDLLTEDSSRGDGFLAEVCKEWEGATQPASDAGIRVVNLRTGAVLSPSGGALKAMLLPFKAGAGGVAGSGKQYMSWISLDDVLYAVYFIMLRQNVTGGLNLVSPDPVTNREFTKTLGKVLRRPTIVPLPAIVIKKLLGDLGLDTILSSLKVEPAKLKTHDFTFAFPDLERALRHVLGVSENSA